MKNGQIIKQLRYYGYGYEYNKENQEIRVETWEENENGIGARATWITLPKEIKNKKHLDKILLA